MFNTIEIVYPNKTKIISMIVDIMKNKSMASIILNLYFLLYFLSFFKPIISYINNVIISITKNSENKYIKICIKLYFGKIYIVFFPSGQPITPTEVFSEMFIILLQKII
jgi:hypothetical protein